MDGCVGGRGSSRLLVLKQSGATRMFGNRHCGPLWEVTITFWERALHKSSQLA